MDTIMNNSAWEDVFTPIVNDAAEKAKQRHRDEEAVADAAAYSRAKAEMRQWRLEKRQRRRDIVTTIACAVFVAALMVGFIVSLHNWTSTLPRKVEATVGLKKVYITETVEKGDTLDRITAETLADSDTENASLYRFQDLKEEVRILNHIANPDRIYAGQKLQIPIIIVDDDWVPEEEPAQ